MESKAVFFLGVAHVKVKDVFLAQISIYIYT